MLVQVELIAKNAISLRGLIRNELRGLDQEILDDFPEVSKLCKGIGTNLNEVTKSILMKGDSISVSDILGEFEE